MNTTTTTTPLSASRNNNNGGIGVTTTTATTATSTTMSFADYWKDDFMPLRAAGDAVNNALRQDEQDGDLYRKIVSGGGHNGDNNTHLYFPPAEQHTATTTTTSNSTPNTNNSLGSTRGSTPRSNTRTTTSDDDDDGDPPPLFQLKHVRSNPLPPMLEHILQTSQYKYSFNMGLLQEANMAYMTIDDTLYIWNYNYNDDSTILSFTVPTHQTIITVGLVHPRKDVFRPHVKYCVVVATLDEVFLIVLAHPKLSTDNATGVPGSTRNMLRYDTSTLELREPGYSRLTGNVRMLAIAGTQDGRIFMGGKDGALYELTYDLGISPPANGAAGTGHHPHDSTLEERLEAFYDDGQVLPDVIHEDNYATLGSRTIALGKRALNSITGEGARPSTRPRKRIKISKETGVSSVLQYILPDFLLQTASFLIGTGTPTRSGGIDQIKVDEARKTLYTLSSNGGICVFNLSSNNNTKIQLVAELNAPFAATQYLGAVARGQGFPPSSGHSVFPGGGVSAQAGVGGMEGARSILNLAKRSEGDNRSKTSAVLKPVSIHVLSPTESSRMTLVAITEYGIRLYLTSLSTTRPASSRGDPFAPWSRLTLCHIRAPPPAPSVMQSSQDLEVFPAYGVIGGILPRVLVPKAARVDASTYNDGIMVAAVMEKEPKSGNRQREPPSTAIVATSTDCIARRVNNPVSASRHEAAGGGGNSTRKFLGGITESISLPMSSADSAGAHFVKLHGGIVYDIAEVATLESSLSKMNNFSSTPTESELSVGLPPAYFPPSKMRARAQRFVQKRATDTGAYREDTAVVAQTSSLQVLVTVFKNIILSRPLSDGLNLEHPLETGMRRGHGMDPNYRISKRNASAGFSLTASEVSSRSSIATQSASSSPGGSRSSKSARLRPWLLRPSAAPLNYLSSQYYAQARELVALNAGGLHFFAFDTVLTSLESALFAGSENVRENSRITRFFDGYGYKEGCCMCLALAIGCGSQFSTSGMSDQYRSAKTAVLARGYIPKLVACSERDSGPMVGGETDPLVPQGYDFRPSYLSEGLTALFSRLVRPIWHKPAVVVTEGRAVVLKLSQKTRQTPAKVEVLLDEKTIDTLKPRLHNLQKLMKDVFQPAIQTVPGLAQGQSDAMDIDEIEDGSILTTALQYNSRMRNASGMHQAAQLSNAEAEQIARLIEEKNIHSLYRLVSRVVQLTSLMSILRRASRMGELPEVDWGVLHGLTISQLVQTPEGQDRLESVLNSLVTASAVSLSQGSATSAELDSVADSLKNECYLFFSPASRYAYLGLRQAREALASTNPANRVAFANEAVQKLLLAAKNWHSAPLITGRILHTKGKESYDQIAVRAMQYGSPLAEAADILVELEEVAGAVKVCLDTAANFKNQDPSIERNRQIQGSATSNDLAWEGNLYHKRRDDALESGSSAGTRGASDKIIAYGTEVTSRDAVDTCFALIFHHLSSLLDAGSPLAYDMVTAGSKSNDWDFLDALFAHLLEKNRLDVLLNIEEKVEKWLKDRNDPDLLWSYYNVQNRYFNAGTIALDRAEENTKISLSDRLLWLSRSFSSFEAARKQSPRGRFELGYSDELADNVASVGETLNFARLQSRVLGKIESESNLRARLSDEAFDNLTNSLVTPEELFNAYAAKCSLYEECLYIIYECRKNDSEAIEKIWKNLFCDEFLRCSTYLRHVYASLVSFLQDLDRSDQVTFLQQDDVAGTTAVFEECRWKESLQNRIERLGKDLYGKGADYVFPVDILLMFLEVLRKAVPERFTPGWSLTTIAAAGVPYLEVLNAYESVTRGDNRVSLGGVPSDSNRRISEKIETMVELFEHWIKKAQANAWEVGQNQAQEELRREVQSGRLSSKIDQIQGLLQQMSEESSSGLSLRVETLLVHLYN